MRRQHDTPKRKRQDETNDVQIEIDKEKEENKNESKINSKNTRKKTAHKGNTHTPGSQAARKGCSIETNNRIT